MGDVVWNETEGQVQDRLRAQVARLEGELEKWKSAYQREVRAVEKVARERDEAQAAIRAKDAALVEALETAADDLKGLEDKLFTLTGVRHTLSGNARSVLADLPAAARERAEERERLREALKLAEWGTEGLCGACEHPDQHQHEPGCLVAKALAGEKAE